MRTGAKKNRRSPSLQSDWPFTISFSWPNRTKIKSLHKVADVPSGYGGARVGVMRMLRLSTVAAVCALGTVICFVAGAVAMASSGVGC
jgi:hypothetical protein